MNNDSIILRCLQQILDNQVTLLDAQGDVDGVNATMEVIRAVQTAQEDELRRQWSHKCKN